MGRPGSTPPSLSALALPHGKEPHPALERFGGSNGHGNRGQILGAAAASPARGGSGPRMAFPARPLGCMYSRDDNDNSMSRRGIMSSMVVRYGVPGWSAVGAVNR